MKSHPRTKNPIPRTPRSFTHWLDRPIIPVFSELAGHETLLSHACVLCLQGIELADLSSLLQQLESPQLLPIPLLVHLDLLAGINPDEAGLRYLSTLPRIDGIITVRPHLLSVAKRLGLRTVLRMFLQDSRAVERGLAVASNHKPDAIELLPGVAAIETAAAFSELGIPRLAGGLIHSADTVARILNSGCRCISTSDPNLWKLNETPARLHP